MFKLMKVFSLHVYTIFSISTNFLNKKNSFQIKEMSSQYHILIKKYNDYKVI